MRQLTPDLIPPTLWPPTA